MNPSKEQKALEKDLIYYLRLFNELKGRYGVTNVLPLIELKIDELIEMIKKM